MPYIDTAVCKLSLIGPQNVPCLLMAPALFTCDIDNPRCMQQSLSVTHCGLCNGSVPHHVHSKYNPYPNGARSRKFCVTAVRTPQLLCSLNVTLKRSSPRHSQR